MQTFGWNLLQFARSVDNLNQEIIEGIKEVASDYFLRKEGLGACYFCVHRTGAMFEGAQAFKTVWSSELNSEAQVVRRFKERGSEESPSLRALAYNENRCLWITAGSTADDGSYAALDSAEVELVDHWREREDSTDVNLPSYVRLHDNSCRTLIALPLKHHSERLGVLVVEFDRHIPITARARHEATLVQEALGRILWLQDASSSQRDGTRKAFDQLKNIVNHSTSSVDPPTLFFAFSGSADESVIQAVKELITSEYGDRIKLISWDDMANPGQITDQVVKEISRCHYGLCYLSEPDHNEGEELSARTYSDNSNVLIEAGMLYALRSSHLAPTIAWIPIREADDRTVPMPFDFVVERMVHVSRDSNGSLEGDEFKIKLKAGIDSMLAL